MDPRRAFRSPTAESLRCPEERSSRPGLEYQCPGSRSTRPPAPERCAAQSVPAYPWPLSGSHGLFLDPLLVVGPLKNPPNVDPGCPNAIGIEAAEIKQ